MSEVSRHPRPRRYFPALLLTFAAGLLLSAAAQCCSYLHIVLSADVLYMSSPWPTVCYFLSSAADIAALFIGYGAMIYYLSVHGLRRGAPLFPLAALASLAGYALRYCFILLEYRHVPLNTGALLTTLSLNYALECGRLLLVAGAALLFRRLRRRDEAARYASGFSPAASVCNLAALLAALLVALSRAAVELFTITLPFFSEVTDVTGEEIFSIVLTYSFLLISAALGYFIAHLTGLLLARAEGSHPDEKKGEPNHAISQ